MTSRTRPSGFAPRIASTLSKRARLENIEDSTSNSECSNARSAFSFCSKFDVGCSMFSKFLFTAVLAFCVSAHAAPPDPEVARMLERALANAENFRKQLQTSEYDAKIRVQEWDGRGRLRGTVKAHAIVRSEEHTSELQSRQYLVCRLLLEKKMTSHSCH